MWTLNRIWYLTNAELNVSAYCFKQIEVVNVTREVLEGQYGHDLEGVPEGHLFTTADDVTIQVHGGSGPDRQLVKQFIEQTGKFPGDIGN